MLNFFTVSDIIVNMQPIRVKANEVFAKYYGVKESGVVPFFLRPLIVLHIASIGGKSSS